MLRRLGPYAGNALTALRVVLTPVFVVLVYSAGTAPICGPLAAAAFCIVATSDVVDGRAARRWGSASNRGRVFDHLADIGFILAALSTYAALGETPWWVPASIAGSFAFYVLDSWSRAPVTTPTLIGSRIGHTAGVLNYALIGVLVFNDTAAIHLLPPSILSGLFWLVPIYSGAAVGARLTARREALPVAPLIAGSD